jgi:Eco57I restriction-modification methylase
MKAESFTTISSVGGLLPPDTLASAAQGRDLPGLEPANYHLIEGETVRTAANRAWTRLTTAWTSFRAALEVAPKNDAATGLTRDKWLQVLFTELGYGRLAATPAGGLVADATSYPVSHIWGAVPIHLVGAGIPLDRRTRGAAGAATRAPHSMMQELLNRSDKHLWGIVSNGRQLRLLRDNASLVRAAYVEFDLEAMFDGEIFSDFVVLYLVCHQSRLEADPILECWLERWRAEAVESGTRALDALRDGVTEALGVLGTGFLRNPGNANLRQALANGTLSAQSYYSLLLRVIYRILFMLVAEERGLLLSRGTDPSTVAARERYLVYFSASRLKSVALRRRGTRHTDRWEALRVVFSQLEEKGCSELGLLPLGGLFAPGSLEALSTCSLSNEAFLGAIRALSQIEYEDHTRSVDFRNLGAEELGSVYESLLELVPLHDPATNEFSLSVLGGNERKTTGSYYTHTALIEAVLDLSLDPLVDEAVDSSDAGQALLSLKVIDPACGSGHFLIAAARRIARRLAAVETGDPEPSPEVVRAALRKVVSNCIYGIDRNELAVELCKVSLWLEGLEPGKPLSFLDHRIQHGNSLVGTTPALLVKGLPDDAFKAIEGDEKKLVSSLKVQNKTARGGQGSLFASLSSDGTIEATRKELRDVAGMNDDSIQAVRSKEDAYRRVIDSTEFAKARLIADAWCSAFFWEKRVEKPPCITDDTLRRIREEPESVPPSVYEEIEKLRAHHAFFHWHLAFADVFTDSDHDSPPNVQTGLAEGFDLVLGNPPWDTLSPDAKEFFSTYDPSVRFQDRDGQRRIIDELLTDLNTAARWAQHCRDLYAQVHFFKNSGRYELFAPGNLGKGDFNVYRMFVESALRSARQGGWCAQVLPSGFYGGANAMAIRRWLYEQCELTHVLGFINTKELWFKNVDSTTRFCAYAARTSGSTREFRSAFFIRTTSDLAAAMSGDMLRTPIAVVKEFSPEALAIMEQGSQLELDITEKIYARFPKFGEASSERPFRRYMAEIHMGSGRKLFSSDPAGLPLYEGRMVDQYDHRAKGYRSGRGRAAVWEELSFSEPSKSIQPQWYIPVSNAPAKVKDRLNTYRAGFCDAVSPRNERSLVAALIPPRTLCGDKVPTFTFAPGDEWAYMLWLCVANSFAMDFIARKKIALKMSYTVVDSLPFPRLTPHDPLVRELVPIALGLTCTGPEMIEYWNTMAADGWVERVADDANPPPGIIGQEERMDAKARIDAIVARKLFELTWEEMSYILDTFPIVKKHDVQQFGDFRTAALIEDHFRGLDRDSNTKQKGS